MSYSFLKKILFCLDPEASHSLSLNSLNFFHRLNLIKNFITQVNKPIQLMGMTLSNPVGLAAGLDKNGDYIDALAELGFGFLEIGTVTVKPQSGNAKPRLFRLTEHQAIINRMGFNNKGVDYLIENLKKTKYKGILGINIGKNKTTPLENAVDDYISLFQRVAPYASYVTLNISSPNTEGLRQLQHGELMQNLLRALKKEQTNYFDSEKKYIPLVVKIAPDLSEAELIQIVDIFLSEKIEGVIATNTTLSRSSVENSIYAKESGGLSGAPLMAKSTAVIKQLHVLLKGHIPIIGCGGILTGQDASEKIAAGASAIQLYSGLVYRGPGLIRECVARGQITE